MYIQNRCAFDEFPHESIVAIQNIKLEIASVWLIRNAFSERKKERIGTVLIDRCMSGSTF